MEMGEGSALLVHDKFQNMGALALETETVFSNDDALLGLKYSIKDNRGNPRVLSLLSVFLEKAIQKNERMLDTSQAKDVITIFHGLRAPSLSIQQYIDRIFKYSCCSPSCFVIAHIYLDRFIQRMNSCLTSLNIHRLLITGVMVAAKFMDDAFFNNAYYARVGGVSTTEMNRLETRFLFAVDFRLYEHHLQEDLLTRCDITGKSPEDSCPNREFCPMTLAQIGSMPEDSVMTSRILPGYVFPYLKNPGTIRFASSEQQDPRGSRRVSRPRYSVAEKIFLNSSLEARPPDLQTYRPPYLTQLIPRGQTSYFPTYKPPDYLPISRPYGLT
ncbi:hypothetical protein F511_03703 [Dorcoceras hygrometricum]|uniref:Cyclin-P3-1 n=1 Tax=Dorcoceras hygrometricum TaxID=472368 RepID=A0A2Z7BDW0_9LAMI|nr:hypothetical protein F511_03703 [Dorcoceras hygrometricum]